MFSGYIRVAAATPAIRVADCAYNAEQILALIKKADDESIRLLCLPELCITGYTCGDLFLQDTLLESARKALSLLVKESAGYGVLIVAGLPLAHTGKLFNVAAASWALCPKPISPITTSFTNCATSRLPAPM